jgi:hypothetical protein
MTHGMEITISLIDLWNGIYVCTCIVLQEKDCMKGGGFFQSEIMY